MSSTIIKDIFTPAFSAPRVPIAQYEITNIGNLA